MPPRPIGGYAIALFGVVYALLAVYVGGSLILEGSALAGVAAILIVVPLSLGIGAMGLRENEYARRWRGWLQEAHPLLYLLGGVTRWVILGGMTLAAAAAIVAFDADPILAIGLLVMYGLGFAMLSVIFSAVAWGVGALVYQDFEWTERRDSR